MTDTEKVADLRSAIERADKVLDWILADPDCYPESCLTNAKRVRNILRASLNRTASGVDAVPGSAPARKALPKHNFKPWQVKGLVKETK